MDGNIFRVLNFYSKRRESPFKSISFLSLSEKDSNRFIDRIINRFCIIHKTSTNVVKIMAMQ